MRPVEPGKPLHSPALRRLAVFRPDTLDLILTKMARGDENDLADISFLLAREPLTPEQLRAAFARARVPEVPEIQILFRAAQPEVLALVRPANKPAESSTLGCSEKEMPRRLAVPLRLFRLGQLKCGRITAWLPLDLQA